MGKACFHCMRVLVIIFNLLFVLIGCAIVGIAIFLFVDQTMKGIKNNMDSKVMVDVILFAAIGVGGVTIVVSTFGCCGAYHESECLLGTYFFCLFVIVATEIAGCLLGFVKLDKEEMNKSIRGAIQSSIDVYVNNYKSDDKLPVHLDKMQRFFDCCGVNGPQDYSGLFGLSPSSILSDLGGFFKKVTDPDRYKKMIYACSRDSIKDTFANLEGCGSKIEEFIDVYKVWILAVCLGVAAFELIAMVVALSLCCSVRRKEAGYVGVST